MLASAPTAETIRRRVRYPANVAPKLELVAPRGYCAGVDRAIETVERVLEELGPPVYVRGEIVHNTHVVSTLAEKGAVFVASESEVPEGQTIILSAHGVSTEVRRV
jgi:4-hydroxy-3-methylbut-2-enyl diphosphate reductase